MKKYIYQARYAGHVIRYKLLYPSTRFLFQPWLQRIDTNLYDVHVDIKNIPLARTMLPEDSSDAYVEYRCLIELTAKALLQYDCCIFHSVSFVWNDYAWLLAAPSGTGKTTQYFNWQELFPDEITMISGDMPVLERRDDGSVWAHPTSWNGKENIGNRICAPVAGIVILKQGQENAIRPLTAVDGTMPFFMQFMVRPESEDEILALTRIMDQMLRNIPVWELVNTGDRDSTRLLRSTLLTRLNELTGNEHANI